MTIESPGEFWKDYELVDSGNFEKLERFGAYYMSRPEPKALWDKTLPASEWDSTINVKFKPGAGFGKAGKEDSGTWDKRKRMEDQWTIKYGSRQKGLNLTLPPGNGFPPRGQPLCGGTARGENPLPRDARPGGRNKKKGRRPALPPVKAVPSARAGLTALFGMGRGGTPPLWPPGMSSGKNIPDKEGRQRGEGTEVSGN